MTADDLNISMPVGDLDAAVRVAQAYIDERGDVPEAVRYSLYRRQVGEDHRRLYDRIRELRVAHFRRLGKSVPPDAITNWR